MLFRFRNNQYGNRVLVTGASSGIGKACAHAFAKSGCQVAGVSKNCEETVRTFPGGGSLCMIRADVTDPGSIRHVLELTGPVDIAVLAAGMGVAGPVEELPLEMAREQMEVNYFGVLNVCSEILPEMREQGHGLIIVISSVAGRVSIPMQSHYSSSKFALEAYVAALRMETRRFGIRACLIEPGDTSTGFTKARRSYNNEGSVYEDVFKASIAKMAKDEQNGKSPTTVARTALRMAAKKNPPVRVPVGIDYKALMILLRLLPDRTAERILMKMYLPDTSEHSPEES